jgi:outer membrane protein assembly factor BamE (lipoprotein component of BamABCDE complex)
MKTPKFAAIAFFALALVAAGGLAAANGFIQSPELLDKIQVGVTTAQQVTEILGPPSRVQQFSRRGVEAWQYWVRDSKHNAEISIEIDSKGVVSNIERIVRYGP